MKDISGITNNSNSMNYGRKAAYLNVLDIGRITL